MARLGHCRFGNAIAGKARYLCAGIPMRVGVFTDMISFPGLGFSLVHPAVSSQTLDFVALAASGHREQAFTLEGRNAKTLSSLMGAGEGLGAHNGNLSR